MTDSSVTSLVRDVIDLYVTSSTITWRHCWRHTFTSRTIIWRHSVYVVTSLHHFKKQKYRSARPRVSIGTYLLYFPCIMEILLYVWSPFFLTNKHRDGIYLIILSEYSMRISNPDNKRYKPLGWGLNSSVLGIFFDFPIWEHQYSDNVRCSVILRP